MPSRLSQPSELLACLDHLWVRFRTAYNLQGGHLEPVFLSSYYLIVVKQGEGSLTLDLQAHRLHQNAVFLAAPGQTVAIQEDSGRKLQAYILEFELRPDTPDAAGSAFPLLGEVAVHFDHMLLQLCEQLCTCCRSGQALERFHGQSVFQELLYWVMGHIRDQGSLDSRDAVERTKAFIDANYEQSLTIEQLARMADISPKYYGSLFKKMFGRTAIDYLTEVRVKKAKQIMAQSPVRLRDVAYKVGYHDEFYFSRMFKREVGVSPTVYLKNRRQKIAAYSAPILGQLLALKIMPYAAPLHPKWTSYYYSSYRAEIPLHLSGFRFNEDWEANVEALARSEASCIITTDQLHPLERERLEHIAPVHVIPLYETTWREQLQMTARIVGAQDEAQAWLHEYDRRAGFVRDQLHGELRGEKLLVVSQFKDTYHLSPTRGMREVVYEDMRMNAPLAAQGCSDGRSLSLEQLASMDPDHILLNVCQETETLHHWEEVQTSRLWQDLKAVRKNQVHLIASDPWREYSAYASVRMINDLRYQLCGNRT